MQLGIHHPKSYGLALVCAGFLCVFQAQAQEVGSCEPALAEAYLDVNNVRARIFNNGGLFWRGDPAVYEVPKGGGVNAVFAAGIWIGGMRNDVLHMAGSTYGPHEFWPGPLTKSGDLPDPSDCAAFDRIYSVGEWDLRVYEETGIATNDLEEWPSDLGAPVLDGNGIPNDYDLTAGDRPDVHGHQALWLVMNDLGNEHKRTNGLPLGIDIRVTAFAYASDDPAFDNTTFFRYIIRNPQNVGVDSTYLAFWVDPDLGDFSDDYVGSDTTLGMGFVYNSDNDDHGRRGYGLAPPALGVDVIQGPIRDADGHDNDRDGIVDEDGEQQPMSAFMFYNGGGCVVCDPQTAEDYYGYMQARWRDGQKATLGGSGRGFSEIPVNFMFPGDPVKGAFWSEVNSDGRGTPIDPADRRFVMATGPFSIAPHDEMEIVFAVVWARGADHLDSLTKLREADRTVQRAWDAQQLPEPSDAPVPKKAPSLLRPADGVGGQPDRLRLHWERVPGAQAHLVEVALDPAFAERVATTIVSDTTFYEVEDLPDSSDVYWRVRGVSTSGVGPVSETRHFRTTSYERRLPSVLRLSDGSPAFVEVAGPGGSDPCTPPAFGCDEAGGRFVYPDTNSTRDFVMFAVGQGPEAVIGKFAPHDYEIRFTSEGSYAYHPFTTGNVMWVPFEVWDIGNVGPALNDPRDDVQLIPQLFSDSGGECEFGYGEFDGSLIDSDWSGTDRIYAYYAIPSYAEWETVVEPLVEGETDRCVNLDDKVPNAWSNHIDFGAGRPIQRIVFFGNPDGPNYRPEGPPEGTVIRFLTTPHPLSPPVPSAPSIGSGPWVQPFTLWWTIGGNERTQVQVARAPDLKDIVFDVETEQDHTVVSGLKEGFTYYWRIRSTNGVFAVSEWSDVWSFIAGKVTNVAAERGTELPRELTLEQNYPNPFNPSTTIRFGIPHAQNVSVEIYDVIGRHVATLVDDSRSAGWHEVSWDATSFASGLYLAVLATDSQRLTRKMLLVR